MKRLLLITIDGPGGSGKGTVAMRLAERMGWRGDPAALWPDQVCRQC